MHEAFPNLDAFISKHAEAAAPGAIDFSLAREETPAERAENERQFNAVVAAYTNPDGSKKPGWLRDPDGTEASVVRALRDAGYPPEVVERTWVQMHTDNYKEWGGDWESLAKIRAVFSALNDVVSGKDEGIAVGLRPDLEAFGGSADVVFPWGNEKYGLQKIGSRRGVDVLLHVLDAVANGEVERSSTVKKTVNLRLGDFRAVLSLDERGTKKTWLLTGWEEGKPDAAGVVSAQPGATQHTPTFSRDMLGAGIRAQAANPTLSVKPSDVSVLVDERGVPMVWWHGALKAGFTVFRGGRRAWATRNIGSFFSQYRQGAATYSGTLTNADRFGSVDEVGRYSGNYAVFLRASDLQQYDFEGNNWDSYPAPSSWYVVNEDGMPLDTFDSEAEAEDYLSKNRKDGAVEVVEIPAENTDTNSLANAAYDMGADAVMFKNVVDDGNAGGTVGEQTVVSVLNPSQIKSAVHNSGGYSAREDIISAPKTRGTSTSRWSRRRRLRSGRRMSGNTRRWSRRSPTRAGRRSRAG
jgi:hypothetical protein